HVVYFFRAMCNKARMAPRKKKWPPNGPTFLAEWREHRGYTQIQVAEMLDVSHTTIGRMESGSSPYQQHSIEALAKTYGCTPADLISVSPNDATASTEGKLRGALLAFGVDRDELDQVIRIIRTYVVDAAGEQSEQTPSEDQSLPSTRRRVTMP